MTATAFTHEELAAFLNRMLEAERAGAKALLVFLEEHSRGGEVWKILRRVQAGEARNCVLIGDLLKRLGVDYSHATGEFFEKAVAVEGARARIEFLVRGLAWAVRELDRALPRIEDAHAREVMERMRDSHRRSIETCNDAARLVRD
jgi:nitronate monooxygenase